MLSQQKYLSRQKHLKSMHQDKLTQILKAIWQPADHRRSGTPSWGSFPSTPQRQPLLFQSGTPISSPTWGVLQLTRNGGRIPTAPRDDWWRSPTSRSARGRRNSRRSGCKTRGAGQRRVSPGSIHECTLLWCLFNHSSGSWWCRSEQGLSLSGAALLFWRRWSARGLPLASVCGWAGRVQPLRCLLWGSARKRRVLGASHSRSFFGSAWNWRSVHNILRVSRGSPKSMWDFKAFAGRNPTTSRGGVFHPAGALWRCFPSAKLSLFHASVHCCQRKPLLTALCLFCLSLTVRHSSGCYLCLTLDIRCLSGRCLCFRTIFLLAIHISKNVMKNVSVTALILLSLWQGQGVEPVRGCTSAAARGALGIFPLRSLRAGGWCAVRCRCGHLLALAVPAGARRGIGCLVGSLRALWPVKQKRKCFRKSQSNSKMQDPIMRKTKVVTIIYTIKQR